MQHTLGHACQRAALGHCVLKEPHKVTGKKTIIYIYIYIFTYIYIYICIYLYITSFLWLVMLCGSCCAGSPEFLAFYCFSHVLACFSIFWCCQCNFCCLLLIFIFRQFLTYVWFFCCCPTFPCVLFFNDKIAHICGAVAFIPGGLLSSCAAMHAAFPRLLHASAFSLLPLCKDTTKGSTMCTANKNKPACSDPWRSDSQACSVTKALQQRSLEMRTWQYVDDHYPSPSCSCHRTRLKAHKAPL